MNPFFFFFFTSCVYFPWFHSFIRVLLGNVLIRVSSTEVAKKPVPFLNRVETLWSSLMALSENLMNNTDKSMFAKETLPETHNAEPLPTPTPLLHSG